VVEDTGGAGRPGEVRPLAEPRFISVRLGRDGQIEAVRLRTWRPVERVVERWRVEEGWWREIPISRTYYELALQEGRLITVFREETTGQWYEQRYD